MVELYLHSPICFPGIVLNCTINKYRDNFTFCLLNATDGLRRKTCLSDQVTGLDDRRIEVRFPEGTKIFLFATVTSCRAHPVSYPMGTGGSFPRGVKRIRADTDVSNCYRRLRKAEVYLHSPILIPVPVL
jgi:hypothetical protein